MGYLNAVELAHAIRRSQPDFLAIPKLDMLRELGETTKIVRSYLDEVTHDVAFDKCIPYNPDLTGRNNRYYKGLIPEYIDINVPQEDIGGIQDFSKIPESYHSYLIQMVELSRFKGSSLLIGTGPGSAEFCTVDIQR